MDGTVEDAATDEGCSTHEKVDSVSVSTTQFRLGANLSVPQLQTRIDLATIEYDSSESNTSASNTPEPQQVQTPTPQTNDLNSNNPPPIPKPNGHKQPQNDLIDSSQVDIVNDLRYIRQFNSINYLFALSKNHK